MSKRQCALSRGNGLKSSWHTLNAFNMGRSHGSDAELGSGPRSRTSEMKVLRRSELLCAGFPINAGTASQGWGFVLLIC